MTTIDDWEEARRIKAFLKHFYDLTLRCSASKFATADTYLDYVCDVCNSLKNLKNTTDKKLLEMAKKMKTKYLKY